VKRVLFFYELLPAGIYRRGAGFCNKKIIDWDFSASKATTGGYTLVLKASMPRDGNCFPIKMKDDEPNTRIKLDSATLAIVLRPPSRSRAM